MKIGEVARDSGVTVDTVRYYERRGVLPHPERTPSGYRVYGDEAVERVRLAKRLQSLGMTLDEVTAALHASDAGDTTCASERWRLEAVLERVEATMAELRAVRREVRTVLAACDAGGCLLAPHPAPDAAGD